MRIILCLVLCFYSGFVISQPLVIAHRGASGYLPEHTIAAATLAHAQNADYIEQDVVLTKDSIAVVLHDIHIDTVTNVKRLYPNRARHDGRFYAIDFTLAELKKLTVHERKNAKGEQVYPHRYRGNAEFKIATLQEHIDLIQELNRQFDKQIGFYPEIKAPAWHREQGTDISQIVLDVLRKNQLDDATKPIYVQCFDFEETKRLRNELKAKVKLVQLIAENSWQESKTDYDYLKTAEGLSEIAKVAQGIGPWIPQILEPSTLEPTPFVARVKQQQLTMHPYTFRIDQLPKNISANKLLDALFNQVKVEGVFTDFPDKVIHFIEQP